MKTEYEKNFDKKNYYMWVFLIALFLGLGCGVFTGGLF